MKRAQASTVIDADTAIGFIVPARNVRGRLVRLNDVMDDVLSAHAYPPVIAHLVADALVLAALLGSMLKDENGQLTLQAQTEEGIVSLLVADFKDGAVRAYADFDPDRLAGLPEHPSLCDLLGKGFLGITFDLGSTGERYQGIVPIEGESLAQAAEFYFSQSEQVPSLAQIAVRFQDGQCLAAGMLVQHMPEGEVGRERLHVRHDHPDWEHVMALARTLSDEELTTPDLSMRDLVWRLFHEEEQVRVIEERPMVKGCRCDVDHFRSVLAKFPAADRADMADENGTITVDCKFCSRNFAIPLDNL